MQTFPDYPLSKAYLQDFAYGYIQEVWQGQHPESMALLKVRLQTHN